MTPITEWILEEIKQKKFENKYEGFLPDIVTLAEQLKWKTEDQIEIKIINEDNKSSIIINNLSVQTNCLPESNLKKL
jgi:hypothetical protein